MLKILTLGNRPPRKIDIFNILLASIIASMIQHLSSLVIILSGSLSHLIVLINFRARCFLQEFLAMRGHLLKHLGVERLGLLGLLYKIALW